MTKQRQHELAPLADEKQREPQLTDAIAPNSLTVVALGSDHFFAEDPRINEKTVALMNVMLTYLEMPANKAPQATCAPSRAHG